jgi:translation elongation factor EF-G
MEVTVPEDKMGAITGDLSGKRGRIQGTDILPGGMAQVKAQAPLSEVMQYQSQLKSVTGGQGQLRHGAQSLRPRPSAGPAADRRAVQAESGGGVTRRHSALNSLTWPPRSIH